LLSKPPAIHPVESIDGVVCLYRHRFPRVLLFYSSAKNFLTHRVWENT
jgi:hypothetical protein